jgi:tRNA (adenine37-N6)-methyltransferase
MASKNNLKIVSIAVAATVVVVSAIFLKSKKIKPSDDSKPKPSTSKNGSSAPTQSKTSASSANGTAVTRKSRPTLESTVEEEGIIVKPIGKVNSIYNLCVGTPRQGMLAPDARGRIELEKFGDSSIVDAVMGLEGYSHIWVLFCFHLNTQPSNSNRIKTKVSPPALGGKKLGILATRTPHRLNPIGITLCKLDRIEKTGSKAILHISGIDLVDGTPIFDIKPYVSFYDSVGGDDVKLPPWVPDGLNTQRNVTFTDAATSELKSLLDKDPDALKFYGRKNGDGAGQPTFDVVSECIRQVLSVDVRSSFQTKKAREGKFQAEKSSRVEANGSRSEPAENLCSQQLDNLLIQYTVTENINDIKLQQSKGSGAEDAVFVISVKLLNSINDVASSFEKLPASTLEEIQKYPEKPFPMNGNHMPEETKSAEQQTKEEDAKKASEPVPESEPEESAKSTEDIVKAQAEADEAARLELVKLEEAKRKAEAEADEAARLEKLKLEEEAKRKAEAEEAARLRAEAEQAARLEQQRLEKEARAKAEAEAEEAARKKAAQEEQAREQERLEAERLEKERLEAERLEKERLAEEERLEQLRLEEEIRQRKEEEERLEAERLEKERLEEEARLEQLRIEEEMRLRKEEEERLEQIRLEEEKRKQEEEEEARRKAEEEAAMLVDPTPAEAMKVSTPKRPKLPSSPARSPKLASNQEPNEPKLLELHSTPKRVTQNQQAAMEFVCSICGVEKPKNQFAKAQIKKRTFRCKDCVAAKLAEES